VLSLEAAAQSPETLSQEAIIENLDPVEAERLSRVRNIGIAVCLANLPGYCTSD
jgi:elongation factor G